MACISILIPNLSFPLGISLAIPNLAIGLNLAINFCCQFSLGLNYTVSQIAALLGLPLPPTVGLSIDVLAPLNALIIEANTVIEYYESQYFVCPFG